MTLIFTEFWRTLCNMAPYLLFGFAVAGALSLIISSELVERHLGGHGIWPILKAALFGIPLPLCSCGVIPVATSLRKHGSSKGATTSFLLSTPQTGADSIMVTFSLLGPVFAIFRPFAAFVAGVLGGSIIEATENKDRKAEKTEPCADECCAHGNERGSFSRALRHGFIVLPRDIALPLLVGLVVAGMIAALVPENFFAGQLGTGFPVMLLMMVLGIPLYVCATASVPIAAAMMMAGVSPGAALVFLMTGPATNAAAVTTLWKIMGKRTAMVYLAVVGASALGCGLLLDYVFDVTNIVPGKTGMFMLPAWIKTVSAICLLGVLFMAMLTKHRSDKHLN